MGYNAEALLLTSAAGRDKMTSFFFPMNSICRSEGAARQRPAQAITILSGARWTPDLSTIGRAGARGVTGPGGAAWGGAAAAGAPAATAIGRGAATAITPPAATPPLPPPSAPTPE